MYARCVIVLRIRPQHGAQAKRRYDNCSERVRTKLVGDRTRRRHLIVLRGGNAPAAPKWVDDAGISEKQAAARLAS